MALTLTSEQEQIQNEARKFLENSFDSEKLRGLLRSTGEYDQAFWTACSEMGWTAAGAPEELDGLGLGAFDVGIIAEGCGRFVCGAPFLAPTFAAMKLIVEAGHEALIADLVPGIISGEVRFALAFFEGCLLYTSDAADES